MENYKDLQPQFFSNDLLNGENEDNTNQDMKDKLINILIKGSTNSDLENWIDLNKFYDENINDIIELDEQVATRIINNSMQIIKSFDQPSLFYILGFIKSLLQNVKYSRAVFESLRIYLLINSILLDSISEEIKNLALNIFTETYFISDEDYSIEWAFNLLSTLNTLIINSIEGNRFYLSTYLSASAVLLKRGVFNQDQINQIFNFYINKIELNGEIDQFFLNDSLYNLEIILEKYPNLYDILDGSHKQIISSIYSFIDIDNESNCYRFNPDILNHSLIILNPLIKRDVDYFLKNSFTAKCLSILERHKYDKLILTTLNCLISFCGFTSQACDQLIEMGFLKRFDIFRYGYKVQIHLLHILKIIAENTVIPFDQKTFDYISNILNLFISGDDDSVSDVLDIVLILANSPFANKFDTDLVDQIYEYGNPDNQSNAKIYEKAALACNKLKENDNNTD